MVATSHDWGVGRKTTLRPGPRTCKRGVPSYSAERTAVRSIGRALQRENLIVAEQTAKEIGWISLGEALEFDPADRAHGSARHPRVAARSLLRYLEESEQATTGDTALAVACLLGVARQRRA